MRTTIRSQRGSRILPCGTPHHDAELKLDVFRVIALSSTFEKNDFRGAGNRKGMVRVKMYF